MGDLSNNFSRREFACQCGCGFDTVDIELVRVLQDLSDHFANTPIEISGPNRCENHNMDIGGVPGSQHIQAKAADIKVSRTLPTTVYNVLIKKYPGKYGIGLYHNRVHIDVRTNPARWTK